MKTSTDPATKLRSLAGNRSFLCLVVLTFLCCATLFSLGYTRSARDEGAVPDKRAVERPVAPDVAQKEPAQPASDQTPAGRPAGPKEPPPPAQDKAPAKLPVILLTGFEPFGLLRSPNPSWEGIRPLDSQEWKGHRLVCKQARVVWGAPMEQLQEWISQYHPVAVFSFGEGAAGSFALESKASNERRQVPDNKGARPPKPKIVDDGPKFFSASVDCARLAAALSEKGHPIRVSTEAGRYLCEEALYTLEYLKSTKKHDGTVLFCHVPPLRSKLRGQPVTAETVQQFVKDVLDSWYALEQGQAPAGPLEPAKQGGPEDPRRQEVKEMIVRYFRTWSEQDMEGYNDCFLPEASIQHINARGRLSTSSRPQFIDSQRDYHRRSPHKTVEAPETIDVRFEEKLARVVVFWKLTSGPRTETGFDHYTLMKNEGKWRIVNLVFYESAR